jgi:glycosyltransferase involved in cell wall biosynthesis
MKIGVDLRNIQKDPDFFALIITLLEGVINSHNSYFFYLFVNTPLDVSGERIFVNYKEGNIGIIDQIKFVQKLKAEKIDVMLFFEPKNAILYTGKFVLFLRNLKEIFYTSEKSPIRRNINLYMYKHALKRAQKIICFDKDTKRDTNERFDIREEKIVQIPHFFIPAEIPVDSRKDVADIAIRSRHSITGDFLIYDAWTGIERNIDRLIECISDINKWGKDISLFIVWEGCSQDLILRHTVISLWMQKKVVFLWDLKPEEEKYYYESALWIVNPSHYDTLPLHATRAIAYKKPMIMSDLATLKNIFWDKVFYFNPLSKHDMLKELEYFLKNILSTDYSDILLRFDKEVTVKITDDIIKKSC